MRLARSTVARRIGCGSRGRSYASTSSASSSILADLAAGNLRTGGSSRARSTRSALPAHSGKVTLSDWSHLEELAGGLRAPMAVRIKDLIQSAEDLTPSKSLRNAQLLHDELVARRASMVAHLLRLPDRIRDHPRVEELTEKQYNRLLRMLVIKRPRSYEEVEQFDQELLGNSRRDGGTSSDGETRRAIGAALSEEAFCPTMLGARRWGDEEADEVSERQSYLDVQLDGVFTARIALRFLTNHYLAAKDPPREGWTGSVQHACSPAQRCEEAARLVEARCLERFGRAPAIQVHPDRDRVSFPFVPEHMDFVLHELMFNGSKATLRKHALSDTLPPMRVIVAAGDADVTIKVADEGGGLPRSKLRRVWSYQGRWGADDRRGLGLPLARLYAKYFGGSLHVTPVEGYGTDCYATFDTRTEASCSQLLAHKEDREDQRKSGPGGLGEGLYDAQGRRFCKVKTQ